jgi:hypothetical protein
VTAVYRVLLPRYWAAAEKLLPECSMDYLATLYAARVKLGVLPSKQWSNSLLAAVRDKLQSSAAALEQRPLPADMVSSSSRSGSSGLLEQQQKHVAGTALKPAVVAQLVWAAGKLWEIAPLPGDTVRLLLTAVSAVLPQCGWNLLTTIGLGLKHMLLGSRQLAEAQAQKGKPTAARRLSKRRGPLAAAARALARRRRRRQQQQQRRLAGPAPSSRLRQGRIGAMRRRVCDGVRSEELSQLVRLVWDAWFARSTELLLQAAATTVVAVAAAPDEGDRLAGSSASILTEQQQLHRPAGSAGKHIQQLQQQAKQVRGLLSCKDVSLQLRLVAALQLQPPADWLAAVVAVTETQVSSSSAQALSWLLLDLVRVQQGLQGPSRVQLPEGFVLAVLRRDWVLHDGQQGQGLTKQQLLRLQSGMRKMREGGDVGDVEWQQWQRLLELWRANQGLAAEQ